MKTLIALMLLTLVGCGKTEKKSVLIPEGRRDEVTTPGYVQLVNEYRSKLGLSVLTYSPMIEELAQGHSLWMSQGPGRFGHYGWKNRCKQLRRELRSDMCGEIVAFGQKTPESVLEAWLGSPSHRRTIENPEWTHTGVGLVYNSDGRPYWTQVFIRIN